MNIYHFYVPFFKLLVGSNPDNNQSTYQLKPTLNQLNCLANKLKTEDGTCGRYKISIPESFQILYVFYFFTLTCKLQNFQKLPSGKLLLNLQKSYWEKIS